MHPSRPPLRSILRVTPQACPVTGCTFDFNVTADLRGTLFWSDDNTWLNRAGGKPKAGENVTVPFGWNLILDEDTPPLADVVVLVSGDQLAGVQPPAACVRGLLGACSVHR